MLNLSQALWEALWLRIKDLLDEVTETVANNARSWKANGEYLDYARVRQPMRRWQFAISRNGVSESDTYVMYVIENAWRDESRYLGIGDRAVRNLRTMR